MCLVWSKHWNRCLYEVWYHYCISSLNHLVRISLFSHECTGFSVKGLLRCFPDSRSLSWAVRKPAQSLISSSGKISMKGQIKSAFFPLVTSLQPGLALPRRGVSGGSTCNSVIFALLHSAATLHGGRWQKSLLQRVFAPRSGAPSPGQTHGGCARVLNVALNCPEASNQSPWGLSICSCGWTWNSLYGKYLHLLWESRAGRGAS